jgi:hypothetical protein
MPDSSNHSGFTEKGNQMSNRYFRSEYIYSMEKDVKQIFADVTFGASGAPTVVAANSKGIRSITRASAGVYNIVFGTPASTQAGVTDVYKKLLNLDYIFIKATAPSAPAAYISSNTIATNGTIQVTFNAAGTATDPASGEEVLLQFIFCDSNT